MIGGMDILSKKLEEKLLQDSKELIYRDCITLCEIYENRDHAAILMSIPYFSLVVHEAESYIQNHLSVTDIKIGVNKSNLKLPNVRNKTHMFDDKFKTRFLSLGDIDDAQDDFFMKDRWAKTLIKKFKLYNNLGIYFNKDGHIVGNTHYIAYVFESANWNDVKNEFNRYGEDLGVSISNIDNYLDNDITNNIIPWGPKTLGWEYKDYNTKKFKTFPQGEDKFLELFFLHFISITNFVLFELPKVIRDNKELLMRIRYIVCHYTHKSMEKLINQARLNQVILDTSYIEKENYKDELICSSFRGCMSHYSFINKENIEIDEEYYSQEIPFFGLVETKFGISFNSYHSKLIDKLKSQSNTLFNYITIDLSGKKKLDG